MYNEKQKQEILEKLSTLQEQVKSRRKACRELGIAESTVRGWEKAFDIEAPSQTSMKVRGQLKQRLL